MLPKKILIILIISQLHFQIVKAQEWKSSLSLFWKANPQFEEDNITSLITKLHQKQDSYKKEEYFLRYLFHKVHQKFLKNYSAYSTMDETLNTQVYDCVTGVALYAIFLREMGYEIEIHETLYHVYLIVNLSEDKKVLFEATDAVSGFIHTPQKIEEKQAEYLNYDKDLIQMKGLTPYDKIITIEELAGIQFYNQALIYYKNYDYQLAYQLSDWAMQLYPNDRIESVRLMSDYYTLELKPKKF